jgi:hypothetical protein
MESIPELIWARSALRALTWRDTAEPRARERAADAARPESAAGVARASVGIMHSVPAPLRHIGCMWLEEGDEAQRCGQPVTWTVGASLDFPRLYCEHHGQRIWEKKYPHRCGRRQAS